ncbi:glycosyltransferase family 2 protein [Ktedonosporobacter rubrisoli]|uniref:Glycosyltransferase family 2 protein n=1 Tax=Ktedonosporobacter rubrisoli TaxID=2509675 RepID=A0A4P6JS41_KTERU|nr:glycosyltransferase family A protein [Ktedonosporobacter rubrisoli]QBD78327.1 glycosyltransferase family 2 protein [Ktedonosporobacter rubrisoli]
MSAIDILLPTYNRLASFIMTLSGIAAQSFTDINLIVADQSQEPTLQHQVVQTLRRVIEARGGSVAWHERPQIHGIVEQRDFLLKQSSAPHVLYLDDDVFMEPWVIEKLLTVLQAEQCAFVGAFPAGLSHRDDRRPQQEIVELWEGPVRPEAVDPGSPQWERWQLHRAANLYHASQALPPGTYRLYKVAWIASCILYDRQKLVDIGGFSFWPRLPRYHSGEEVLVQNLLMRRWGGCAIMPSGTYYSQVSTTVLNEAGTVDGHALDLLPEMIERYAPQTSRTGARL